MTPPAAGNSKREYHGNAMAISTRPPLRPEINHCNPWIASRNAMVASAPTNPTNAAQSSIECVSESQNRSSKRTRSLNKRERFFGDGMKEDASLALRGYQASDGTEIIITT